MLAQVEIPKSLRNDKSDVFDDSNKTCYLCGLKGHIARNCPGSDQAPDAMKCQLCHRYVHRTEYCWEDEKNASRRPERWRSILPNRKDKEEDPVLVSYSLMSCLRDEFDPASDEEDDSSLCLEPLEPSTDDLMAWQQAIEQELELYRQVRVFETPDLEGARAVKNELYSPIIVPPVHEDEEDDIETTELVTILEELSSDEETALPFSQHQAQKSSERPLAPYWYLRRHRERYESGVDTRDTHSPTTVNQFPYLTEQGSNNNTEQEMIDYSRETLMADATSAYTLVNTNHDTRPPSEFSMPSFEGDREGNQASDDSDVEVVPVPAAAYAHPNVYRSTQREEASDYDSVREDGFIYDSEEDSPYEPELDNVKNSDDDEMNSFCTNVGDEVDMLSSPSGTIPFDPIDLTISMESTETQEQESQALFSDESESVEDSSPRRVIQYPDQDLFWDIRREQAFLTIRMEDVCAFTGRNIPYHGRRMTTDASRRAFNHLLLEEEIMRYEREQMIRGMGHHGPIGSSDAANRQVMTALNPEYVSEVVDAINCGHDFENARVFSYVSDDETIMSETSMKMNSMNTLT